MIRAVLAFIIGVSLSCTVFMKEDSCGRADIDSYDTPVIQDTTKQIFKHP